MKKTKASKIEFGLAEVEIKGASDSSDESSSEEDSSDEEGGEFELTKSW